MYDLEEARVIEEIQKRKAKRVLLQVPEGLKKEAMRLTNLIQEKTQAVAFFSGEPCWGACDLPLDEAKQLNIDLIVHFGHAPFHKPDFPILYIEARYITEISAFINKNIAHFTSFKRIGLVASVQHVHQLPVVKKLFEENGITVLIPKNLGRAFHYGQILGCEYTGPKLIEKDVDAYVALSNQFHSLGLALSTEKPVFIVDPMHETIDNLKGFRNKIMRQRYAIIEQARKAYSFGILLSTKSGQVNRAVAEQLEKKLHHHQKEAVMISMKEIRPDELINFNVDAYVTTACPRVAVEDLPRYGKPVLTIRELLVVLGELSLEDLNKEGFITAPYGTK